MASFVTTQQTRNDYEPWIEQQRRSTSGCGLPYYSATTAFGIQARNNRGTLFVLPTNSPFSSATGTTGTTSTRFDNDDDDDDDDDDMSMYIYPPRPKHMFQNTNIVSRTMAIPESPFWEKLLPPPPTTTTSTDYSPSSFFAFMDDRVDGTTNQYQWIPNVFRKAASNNNNKDGGVSSRGDGRKRGKQQPQSSSSSSSGGIDESIEFTDAGEGANALVRQCLESTSGGCQTIGCECDDLGTTTDGEQQQTYNDVVHYLTGMFSYYQEAFEQQQQPQPQPQPQPSEEQFSFKARIVSSSGPVGQKCPRWHVDHVPVRLVLSLVGPGCVYISHEAEFRHSTSSSSSSSSSSDTTPTTTDTDRIRVDRHALNELIEFDTNKANGTILPSGEGNGLAVTASPGEAILMMGRGWEEEDVTGDNDVDHSRGSVLGVGQDGCPPRIDAVPHRSPDLGLWERRILLTVDIVPRTTTSESVSSLAF